MTLDEFLFKVFGPAVARKFRNEIKNMHICLDTPVNAALAPSYSRQVATVYATPADTFDFYITLTDKGITVVVERVLRSQKTAFVGFDLSVLMGENQ